MCVIDIFHILVAYVIFLWIIFPIGLDVIGKYSMASVLQLQSINFEHYLDYLFFPSYITDCFVSVRASTSSSDLHYPHKLVSYTFHYTCVLIILSDFLVHTIIIVTVIYKPAHISMSPITETVSPPMKPYDVPVS